MPYPREREPFSSPTVVSGNALGPQLFAFGQVERRQDKAIHSQHPAPPRGCRRPRSHVQRGQPACQRHFLPRNEALDQEVEPLRTRAQSEVEINALARLPRAPAPRPSRPQPRMPHPRWSRGHRTLVPLRHSYRVENRVQRQDRSIVPSISVFQRLSSVPATHMTFDKGVLNGWIPGTLEVDPELISLDNLA